MPFNDVAQVGTEYRVNITDRNDGHKYENNSYTVTKPSPLKVHLLAYSGAFNHTTQSLKPFHFLEHFKDCFLKSGKLQNKQASGP